MYEDKRNQIIGTVLSCMFFLIIGGFITCSYGQVSQIGKTAIKTAMGKNAVKAAVGKAIIDGFLNQNDILSNDFRQMYKNDTTLKGTAILPLTSQIEIEKKQRMLMDLLKKSSDSIISKTELNGRQFEYLNEYIKYLTKGTKCLQNKDSLQAIHHFISADSVIQKHPDIIKNDTLSKYHSQILVKIGLFYFTDKNRKKTEQKLYCMNCINKKMNLQKNLSHYLNLNNSYNFSLHNNLSLKQLDEDYISNKIFENEKRQLAAFNHLKSIKELNPVSKKDKLQFINENCENPFHGLNLQDYLYYNNKMKNEKINKLVLSNVTSYELNEPRKEIFDYYNKVMFQTPLLEKDERPSNQYKMRYIKTLQNQIDEKKKEKINKKKAEIKKEKKE